MVRHLQQMVAVCLAMLVLPRMIFLAEADMTHVETSIFRDDFESYRAGAFPSSSRWVLIYDGLGRQSQYITNQSSFSPVKSFQLIGAPMWASAVDRSIDRGMLSGKTSIGFEAYVKVDDYGYSPDIGDRTTACICFANRTLERWGRLYSAIRFLSDGGIYAVTGVTKGFEYLQDYSLHQWYRVRVEVDMSTDRFDVWVDGQLRGSFTITRGHASEIATLNIASGHATSRVYFDDVEVFMTGSREVMFRGRVLANRPVISFYSIDIKVDEILQDTTGKVAIGNVLTVWGPRYGSSSVENPPIGDRVEVFGIFSGNATRAGVKSEYVDLETSQHYLGRIDTTQPVASADKWSYGIGLGARLAGAVVDRIMILEHCCRSHSYMFIQGHDM